MRWGKKREYRKTIIKRKFALFPMNKFNITCAFYQWRWLEFVEYKGYYYKRYDGTILWNDLGWVD